jgi:hypothetical protein
MANKTTSYVGCGGPICAGRQLHIGPPNRITAFVAPATTAVNQSNTLPLRALVEPHQGHGDCIMPHTSARYVCVESLNSTDTSPSCLLVTQILAKFPLGTIICDLFTTNKVNSWERLYVIKDILTRFHLSSPSDFVVMRNFILLQTQEGHRWWT